MTNLKTYAAIVILAVAMAASLAWAGRKPSSEPLSDSQKLSALQSCAVAFTGRIAPASGTAPETWEGLRGRLRAAFLAMQTSAEFDLDVGAKDGARPDVVEEDINKNRSQASDDIKVLGRVSEACAGDAANLLARDAHDYYADLTALVAPLKGFYGFIPRMGDLPVE